MKKSMKRFLGIPFLCLILSACGGGAASSSGGNIYSSGQTSSKDSLGSSSSSQEKTSSGTSSKDSSTSSSDGHDHSESSQGHSDTSEDSYDSSIEDVVIESSEHEHTFADDFDYDEEGHYHPAICGHDEISGYESHTYKTTTVEATYETSGYIEKTCVVCGYSFKQEILPQLEHRFSEEYEHDEEKHWHPCLDAGYETLKGNEEKHLYGDWIVDTEAAMDVEGAAHRVCSICGYAEEKVLDALPHVHDVKEWVYSDTIVPSGEEDAGFTTVRHGECSLCGEDVVEDIVFGKEDGVVMDKASYLSAIDTSQAEHYRYWFIGTATTTFDLDNITSGPQIKSSALVFTPDYSTERAIAAKRAEYVFDSARIDAFNGSRELVIKGLIVPGETSPRYFCIGSITDDGGESYVAAVNSYGISTYLQSYKINYAYEYYSATMASAFRTADEFNALISLEEDGTHFDTRYYFEDVTFSAEYDCDETSHWHNADNLSYGNVKNGVEPHTFDAKVVPPTFETEGFTVYTCSVCGYHYNDDFVDPLAHSYSAEYTHDESHHWRTCVDEGYETEKTDFAAHDYGEWIVDEAAKMDVEGSKHRVCETCGYVEQGVIDALPHVHSYSEEWSGDATHHWHQAVCVHETEKSAYALHDYDEGVITVPTLTDGGYTTYTCKTCGYHYVDENSRTAPLYESESADFIFSEVYHNPSTDTDYVTITAYTGNAETVYLPRYYGDYVVAGLDRAAFTDNATVKEIYIPATVTSVEWGYGFAYAKSLEKIHIDENNPSYKVVDGLVYNKKQTKLMFIPNQTAGEITIPEGVTGLDSYFSATNAVTALHLPKTWSYKDTQFLRNFSSLETVTVAEGNTVFKAQDNVLYNPDMTSILFIPNRVSGSLVVPSTVTNDISFGWSKFTSIDLSATSITAIPDDAFQYCSSLKEVKFPSTVTSIGKYAFEECTSLKTIEIAEGVTTLGGYLFSGCSALTDVSLPSTLVTMPDTVFQSCKSLKNIEISASNPYFQSISGVIYDGEMNIVFIPDGLSGEVVIPDGVTSIGDKFASCYGITKMVIGKDVADITSASFPSTGYYPASLTDIEIDADNPSFKSVDGCVYDKDVTTLIHIPSAKLGIYRMPDTVTKLARESAFYGKTALYMIVLNDKIEGLTSSSFYRCNYLKYVVNPSPSEITTYSNSSFEAVASESEVTAITDENGFIYSGETKQTLIGYMGAEKDVVIPEGVVTIDDQCFYGLTITSLTLSSTVEWIGGRICQNCTNLVTVKLNEGLKRIWQYAFYGCTALTTIEFPSTLHTIATCAFGASGLVKVYIPSTVTELYEQVFSECKNLVRVDFYATVSPTQINFGNRLFGDCPALKEVVIDVSMKHKLPTYLFIYCPSLTEITYKGTIEEFEALLGNQWNYQSPISVVHCSDGDYAIS